MYSKWDKNYESYIFLKPRDSRLYCSALYVVSNMYYWKEDRQKQMCSKPTVYIVYCTVILALCPEVN
jgi:hypothetical protein